MSQQHQQQLKEVRRISLRFGTCWMPSLSALLALLVLTTGCSRRTEILHDQLGSLEEDLEGIDERIERADEELAEARAALTSSNTAMVVSDRLASDGFYFMSPEDLGFSFHSSLKAVASSWREQLERQGATLVIKDGSLTVPGRARHPYRKPIAFTERGGVTVTLEAKADWDGEWTFPSTEQISDRIVAAGRRQTPRASQPTTKVALFMPTSRPATRPKGKTSTTTVTKTTRRKRSRGFRSGERSEWHLPDEARAKRAEIDPSRIPRAVPLQLPSRHRARVVSDPNFTLAPSG